MTTGTDLINVVLDKSGSMTPIAEATLSAINEFIDDQMRHFDNTLWTLTMFDTLVTPVFIGITSDEVQPLTATDYQPGGMTALYDAVGSTILGAERDLARVDDHGTVTMVVITDGMENSSRRFGHRQVHSLISAHEEAGWQFVFLGADQDSWAVGEGLGIRKGAAMKMDRSPDSMKSAMAAASAVTADYRTSKKAQMLRGDYRDKGDRR